MAKFCRGEDCKLRNNCLLFQNYTTIYPRYSKQYQSAWGCYDYNNDTCTDIIPLKLVGGQENPETVDEVEKEIEEYLNKDPSKMTKEEVEEAFRQRVKDFDKTAGYGSIKAKWRFSYKGGIGVIDKRCFNQKGIEK